MTRGLRPGQIMAVLGALLVVLLATFLPAGAASAHAELISVNPANGATVRAVPAAVVLTFGEAIDPNFVRARLAWPGGASAVTPSVKGVTVTVPAGSSPAVAALADPNGAYGVTYYVVSKDGHPVSGKVSFTVAGGPTATPLHTAVIAPAPTVTATDPSPSASASTGTTSSSTMSTGTKWLILGGGIVVAAGVAGAAVVTLRRMKGPQQ